MKLFRGFDHRLFDRRLEILQISGFLQQITLYTFLNRQQAPLHKH